MKFLAIKYLSTQRIVKLLSSSNMFKFIIGLFILQATWIALSGLYPMAFDEDFHFGIIKIYAEQLSPFLSSQPDAANAYGAVYRDPSYLFHYLMSFPYRLISLFIHDQTIQVILLRLINIALFAWGITIFRKVLVYTGASKAIINLTLLIFILIPVIPLLAAHINYDNLFFPLVGLVFLLTLTIVKRLRSNKEIRVDEIFGLFTLLLLTSLVKYAFLPILLVVILFVLIHFIRTFTSFGEFRNSFILSWSTRSVAIRTVLVLAFGLSIVLFSQRYLVNTYQYHTPFPDCSKVLSVEACSEYGPWQRDYRLEQNKIQSSANVAEFSAGWIYGMWFRLFFSVDGPATQNETRGALLFPASISIVVSVVGILLLIKNFRKILHTNNNRALWFFALVSAVYISVLWLDQFEAFNRTGTTVAINGRYLLPVLLPIMLLIALSFRQSLKNNIQLKTILASVTIIFMLWGGGAMTYIIRSNSNGSWWWPNTYTREVNLAAKSVFQPIMPGFYDRGGFWR